MLVERGPKPRAPTVEGGGLACASERRATGQGLEAADIPAPADDIGVVGDLDVPDVAGRSPARPRWRRPSEMMPAPIPVPILTTTTLSWPAATPDRHSPRARTLTSLSTQTGAP